MGVLYSKKNGVWLSATSANAKQEPFNDALALVGIGKVSNLNVVLGNSAYCLALAGNAEAVTIMAENYKAEISECNTNYYSIGLNTLAFKCKARTYLLKGSNKCTEIVGSWTNLGSYNATHDGYQIGASCYSSPVVTGIIDFTGFNKLYAKFAGCNIGSGANLKMGTTTSKTGDTSAYWTQYTEMTGSASTYNPEVSLSASQKSLMLKITTYSNTTGPHIPYIYIE